MNSIGPLMSDEFTDVRVSLALIETLANGEYTNGQIYYVDGNAGDDLKDGLSWANAMRTVAVALAASHANIAASESGWASRNRIYVKGDAFEENLTKLAQKTDVIGVGSYNQWMKPGIKGNHAINGTTWVGTRFFNIHFSTPVGGGDIFTLPATTRGIEFHDCLFDGTNTGTPPGGAIITAAVWFLTIKNCEFVGDWSDAIIEIGVGNTQGLVIENNYIEGDNQGIDVNASATTSPRKGLIKGNTFHTALACINDASGVMVITGNRGATLAVRGLHLAGAVVGSDALASDNRFTCADGNNIEWPIPATFNPSGGRDYYVDSNAGHDTNNSGSSWDDAYLTLTVALAASHAWIATGSAGWAARNRIFYKGDGNTESLTTLAQKTDVIGVGSGGGHQLVPDIIGTHVIVGTGFVGCRFYNLCFKALANTDDIFTLSADERGIEFHGCRFNAHTSDTISAGSAIVSVSQYYLVIDDCDFVGEFTDSVIEILSGVHNGLQITNNRIQGGDNDGIEFVTGIGCSVGYDRPLVKGNVVDVQEICINDADESLVRIINNRCITENAKGTGGAGAIVGNEFVSCGNKICASDLANADWPALGAL